jgi:hypothetical protein
MMTKPSKKTRKSNEHGQWHYNELPPVLHGADCAELSSPGAAEIRGVPLSLRLFEGTIRGARSLRFRVLLAKPLRHMIRVFKSDKIFTIYASWRRIAPVQTQTKAAAST